MPQQAIIGPYLYFMCDASAGKTGEKVSYEKIDADFVWPGTTVVKH